MLPWSGHLACDELNEIKPTVVKVSAIGYIHNFHQLSKTLSKKKELLHVIISSSESGNCRVNVTQSETFIIFASTTKSNDRYLLRPIPWLRIRSNRHQRKLMSLTTENTVSMETTHIENSAIDPLCSFLHLIWSCAFPSRRVLKTVLCSLLGVPSIPSVTGGGGSQPVKGFVFCIQFHPLSP